MKTNTTVKKLLLGVADRPMLTDKGERVMLSEYLKEVLQVELESLYMSGITTIKGHRLYDTGLLLEELRKRVGK